MAAEKIAIVCANGLGDGLLSLVLAHNLALHNYQVTTYSNYLTQLRSWFPEKNIAAFPDFSVVDQVFSSYDRIVSTDGAFLARIPHNLGSKHRLFYERNFDRSKTVLENFLEICQQEFGITAVTKQNGIVVPADLQFRKNNNRLIIHPMSTSPKKNWPAEKFMHLAKRLRKKNYEPVFVVGPNERLLWQEIVGNQFSLPFFANISELACFIYESGYMIGNDSGIGHLAANLGIPTLSLFARRSVANLWRPAWGRGIVVTPTFQLPGARLRTKHWQKFLTVGKVLAEFEKLTVCHGHLKNIKE